MRHILTAALLLAAAAIANPASAACADVFDHSMRRLHAKDDVNLCEVTANRPVLVVNTASHCGYTPQFKGLEALHQRYREQGLVVVGFASDSFSQEADSEAKAADVCYVNYGVTFTMLAPTPVRGSVANPVFQALNERAGEPKWNFNKYLISADGQQVQHFDSSVRPDSEVLAGAIEEVL